MCTPKDEASSHRAKRLRFQAYCFLYYRLNVVSLHLQRLKDRARDITMLDKYFIHVSGSRHGVGKIDFRE